MRWRTPDLRKAGIVITGILLLLVFKTWVPLSVASAHQGTLGLATPGTVTVQATPTEDATMTALSKEKLVQEVQQLKDQNEPDFFGWLRANASLLLSTLVVVVGGLIGLWRWLGDRRDAQEKVLKDQQSEREKRAEERFQAAVTGLADNKEGARIGAAILLRTFLRPGYEQFYTQTFDLAVANLRLPRTPPPPEDPDGLSHPPENPTVAQSLTTLSQALIVVYKESFPLARDTFLVHDIFKEEDTRDSLAFLDASHIQLDHAYLHTADLKQAWLPHAFLRKANLSKANLSKADLSEASLFAADLRAANLFDANLSRAGLSEANLSRAGLTGANLSEAKLRKTDLARADLRKTNLSGADLSEAKLTHADLHQAKLTHANFSGADLSRAKLIDADLRNTTLSKANLCKATLTGAKFIHDVDLIPNAKLRAAKVSKENRLLANFTRKILHLTNLSDVNFSEADLSKATLTGVTLTRANLSKANLSKANLLGADLSGADLSEARFLGADLIDAKLNGANLSGADLSEADLSGADLINVKLNGAQFDRAVLIECHLDGTNLEEAHSLEGTDLRGVKGLTKEQLEACKAKGAIIDEAPTSSASQSTTAPSPSSQSNDAQASSVPSAQGSASTPDAGGSSTVSPQQEPGS